jgi:hypothetical protein
VDQTVRPVRRGGAIAATTTPERVLRLRQVVAAAARGDSLLLCTELRDPTQRAAEATADLATLAAFTLAYATGRPVPTVLGVHGAVRDLTKARDQAAVLGWVTGDRPGQLRGPIARVQSWMARLSLSSGLPPAEAAFMASMYKAWGFATAYGGKPAAVANVLAADRFLAWPSAAGAHPRTVRDGAGATRYGVLSPAVLVRAGARSVGLAGEIANTVVLRLSARTRAEELARLCARLDPQRAAGKLVLLVPRVPDARLARLVRAVGEEHRPAWVLSCESAQGTGERLRGMSAVLDDHGAPLGGVSLGAGGRRLDQVVRLATVLSAQSTVSILDRAA